MKLPKSKTENIVVQHLTDEVLTYDLATHEAYCLNSTSAIVYQACNGNTTFEDLTRQYKYPVELIYLTLDILREKNLLAENHNSIFAGVSRREAIKKVGLATLIALPLISGLIAPKAANAASGQGSNQLNYGASCITVNDCPGLDCHPIANICCNPAIDYNPNVIKPGESYRNNGQDIVIRGTLLGNSDTDTFCSGFACCAGGSASGSCTYTPFNEEPNPEFDSYYADCVCTCP